MLDVVSVVDHVYIHVAQSVPLIDVDAVRVTGEVKSQTVLFVGSILTIIFPSTLTVSVAVRVHPP